MLATSPRPPGALTERPAAPRARVPLTRTDIVVYLAIIVVGSMHYALTLRSSDFFRGDTTGFELARSLLGGFYGFNFRPETMIPPGFPAIMALLCVAVGCRYSVFLHAVVVFWTLGVLASYELLRRMEGRAAAAVVSMLLISSPFAFGFATGVVFSDLPYLFTSMVVLLLARCLDDQCLTSDTNEKGARDAHHLGVMSQRLLCGLALIASLSIRSAGVALLIGLIGWLAASWLLDRPAAGRRLRLFLPLVVAAILAQAAWMSWVTTHEVVEWPIGGYPRSYVSQLGVKSGNHPELGPASLADIPARVTQNLADHVAGFTALLIPLEYINPIWSSPLMLGPLLLLIIGLGRSMWSSGGGLPEWYFVAYQTMYLLWPWALELRFLIPVAPLAGLYAWRGGKQLLEWIAHDPRRAVTGTLVLALPAATHAGAVGWRLGSRQPAAAAVFWLLLAVGAVVWASAPRRRLIIGWLRRSVVLIPSHGVSLSLLRLGCVLMVTLTVGIGLARQISLGLDNLAFDVTTRSSYPDIEAGQWLRAHTAVTTVVMARQVDVVYHYSRRKVVWFPPISEPWTLMDGIRKYGVQFVVINHRALTYFQPPEADCFAGLAQTYPASFRLIHRGSKFDIYEVAAGG